MNLYHCTSRQRLEEEFEKHGCWRPEPDAFFFARNAWSLLRRQFANVQDPCFIVISDQNTSKLKTRKDPKGEVDVYQLQGCLYKKDVVQILSLEEFEEIHRIHILMNTSMIDEKWCRSSIRPYLKSSDRVCVCALSFFDDTKNLDDWNRQYKKGQGIWYRANTDVFAFFGIPENQVCWIEYFTDTPQQMKNKIANSNVILFTGGAPDLMMKRIRQLKLKPLLKEYQGVIIGYSAGAMIQLEDYHITPDEDYAEFSWHKGLGYLRDAGIEVHFCNTKHQRLWMEKAYQDNPRIIYGIYEEGGLIFSDNKLKSIFGKVDTFFEERDRYDSN